MVDITSIRLKNNRIVIISTTDFWQCSSRLGRGHYLWGALFVVGFIFFAAISEKNMHKTKPNYTRNMWYVWHRIGGERWWFRWWKSSWAQLRGRRQEKTQLLGSDLGVPLEYQLAQCLIRRSVLGKYPQMTALAHWFLLVCCGLGNTAATTNSSSSLGMSTGTLRKSSHKHSVWRRSCTRTGLALFMYGFLLSLSKSVRVQIFGGTFLLSLRKCVRVQIFGGTFC